MKPRLRLVFTLFSLAFFSAQSAIADDVARETLEENSLEMQIILPGDAVELGDLKWQKRVLIVFADSVNDPRYIQQMDFITDRLEDLNDRDVIVLTDTDDSETSALRQKLRPRGFMLTMIGKDGQVYLRKPLPWDVREISRTIDKMPMRQQEIRDRRGAS